MDREEKKIYYVKGMPVPETPAPQERPEGWARTSVVGKPLPRVDAYERLSGSAVYASDITMPGMLYGAILRCPHAHAVVKSIDTRQAEKMPGVRAVLTGSSPKRMCSGTTLPTSRRSFSIPLPVRGEAVAAVAAETPYHAWDALRSIKVEYEVLPFPVR